MDFNNFNSGGFGGGYGGSSRDKLEIGESGKTRGEEKEAKRLKSYGNRPSSRYGSSSRRGMSEGGRKLITTVLFWAFALFVLFSLNLKYEWINLGSMSIFNTAKVSQEEGVGSLNKAVKDIYAKNGEVSGTVKKLPAVYAENNLHNGTEVYRQTDDEYLVYVYTGSEADAEFNRFVEMYQEDIKIYKLDKSESVVDFKFDKEFSKRSKTEPYFVLIDRLGMNEQIEAGYYFEDNLGSIIEDVNQLKQRQMELDN